jgi:hypothetical protein
MSVINVKYNERGRIVTMHFDVISDTVKEYGIHEKELAEILAKDILNRSHKQEWFEFTHTIIYFAKILLLKIRTIKYKTGIVESDILIISELEYTGAIYIESSMSMKCPLINGILYKKTIFDC